MEKELKHINLEFRKWLDKLLLSKTVDFFILYELRDLDILGDQIVVSIRDDIRNRSVPIAKPQGLLNFNSKEVIEIQNEFLNIVTSALSNNHYSNEGLVNYLILIDRLGTLYDQQHYDMTYVILDQVPPDTYLFIIDLFIDLFNKEYKFSHLKDNTNLNCKQWNDLFHSIQYIDRTTNPIDLLRRIIKFKLADTQLLDFTKKILPDTRASLFEYGIELNEISADSMISFLELYPEESSFISALIIDNNAAKSKFLEGNLITYLIEKHWDDSGKYFFRKAASDGSSVNEDSKNIIIEALNSFLKHQFSSDNITIIKNLTWPEDYLALGGWLMYNHNKEPDFIFSSKFYEELALAFGHKINDIKNKLLDYIRNSQSTTDLWFRDQYDQRVQYILGYIAYSIFICSDDNFQSFLKKYKNLLFELKELYYGAYQANYLAQKISSSLLCLLFAYPTVTENTFKRLKELIDAFSTVVGYQWVIYSERNELIWNNSSDRVSFIDMELNYALIKMKQVSPAYKEIVVQFKNEIANKATVKWPFDETPNQPANKNNPITD